MCSVDPDNLESHERLMPAVEKLSISDLKCNKCKEATPCVLLRKKDAYCKNCFLNSAFHKFKMLLGKAKLVRPKDRVLILYKIGHAGTAILHLLRAGLDLTTAKKIMFEPIILFVEESSKMDISKRKDLLTAIKNQVNDFNFKLYYVSFAEYLVNKENNLESLIQDTDNNMEIRELAENSSNPQKLSATWQDDVTNINMRKLLIDVAKFLNCQFVFTPEISSDTACDLLTNVALGRGANITLDTGFCDNRDDDVKILRPMRLFDMKELVYYNTFNNIEPIPYIGPKINYYSSIKNLMTQFVNDLQENYPATITTVLRTGDKLSIPKSKTDRKCEICLAIIQSDINAEASAEEATKFSHFISTHKFDNTEACSSTDTEENYNQVLDAFQSNVEKNTDKRYCFTCSKIADFIL